MKLHAVSEIFRGFLELRTEEGFALMWKSSVDHRIGTLKYAVGVMGVHLPFLLNQMRVEIQELFKNII